MKFSFRCCFLENKARMKAISRHKGKYKMNTRKTMKIASGITPPLLMDAALRQNSSYPKYNGDDSKDNEQYISLHGNILLPGLFTSSITQR